MQKSEAKAPVEEKKHKGHALIAQAEARLKSWSFLGLGGTAKFEDAAELYEKAAAQFKIKKDWVGAAQCYVKAAENAEKAADNNQAISNYVSAAKAYQNAEAFKDALKWYEIAVTLHMDNNRFGVAAGLWKAMADLEEKQLNNKGAIKAWTEAGNCYEAANQPSQQNNCLIKIADLAVEDLDYAKGIALYEQVSKVAAGSQLGRWSVKEHLFKAALCQLAMGAQLGDVKGVPAALENYKVTFPAFDDTREVKLVEHLVEAFEEDDSEKLTGYIFEYNQIYKLDAWKTKVLLAIKTTLHDGTGGAGEEDEVASGLM